MIVCAGCGFPSAMGVRHVELRMPDAPAGWAGLPGLRFACRYVDPAGQPAQVVAAEGEVVRVAVPVGLAQAILAVPYLSGVALRPAGALYPWDVDASGRIALDFEQGYAAAIAALLEDRGLDAWIFALGRIREARQVQQADPWSVDPAVAAARLVAGTFRTDLFTRAKRFRVALPDGGPWVHESPFAGTMGSETGADAADGPAEGTVSLWPGVHRFAGPGGGLALRVDAQGNAEWVRSGLLAVFSLAGDAGDAYAEDRSFAGPTFGVH